jgi:hypothetical protein
VPARPWIGVFLLMTALALLAGCGGSTLNVQNPPPPNQQGVSIKLTTTLPSLLFINNNTSTVTATVSNDSQNAGVDWTLVGCQNNGSSCSSKLCANFACGQLVNASGQQEAHSASGDTLTYHPPATTFPLPGGAMVVEILAFATAEPSQNQMVSTTISAFSSVLNGGNYVFQAQGSSGSSSTPFQIAGVLALDATASDACFGYVTGGQQTFNTVSNGSVASTIAGSSDTSCGPSHFFVGPDGRGTITLVTSEGVTEPFSLVVLSSSKALIANIDKANNYSAFGTLEAQDPTAANTRPGGGFAFVADGTDSGGNAMDVEAFYSTAVPTALGGVLTIDSNGNILGASSLADQDYYDYNSNSGNPVHPQLESCVPPAGLTGAVQAAAPGVVTISLTGATCFSTQKNGTKTPAPSSLVFTGYIVDANHIRIIESDVGVSGSETYNPNGFLTAGVAVSQGSSAGTFTDASLSGQYVFDALGANFSYQGGSLVPSSFTSASAVNAQTGGTCPAGEGCLTGITDSLFYETYAAFSPTVLQGTYTVDGAGIGRADLALVFQTPAPKPRPTVLFYLTGDGNPLVLYAGGEDPNFPAVGTGAAYLQASNPQSLSLSGHYGIAFAQTYGSENDGSGLLTATPPLNGNPGTITGLVDDFTDSILAGGVSIPLADIFECPPGAASCPDSLGRYFYYDGTTYYATFLGYGGAYYMIDPTQGFFVETDLTNATLGYFAAACDVSDSTGQSCRTAKPSQRQNSSRPHGGKRHAY